MDRQTTATNLLKRVTYFLCLSLWKNSYKLHFHLVLYNVFICLYVAYKNSQTVAILQTKFEYKTTNVQKYIAVVEKQHPQNFTKNMHRYEEKCTLCRLNVTCLIILSSLNAQLLLYYSCLKLFNAVQNIRSTLKNVKEHVVL